MKILFSVSAFLCGVCFSAVESPLVDIKTVDPSIVVEARYFTDHNFLGRPVAGYKAGKCLLTKPAALALKKVQAAVKLEGYSLKAYDCYRPQRGVDDFIAWAKDPADQKTKGEFYPRVDKKDVFKLGFVAAKSGHSRGSTIDLTLVKLPIRPSAPFKLGDPLVDCAASDEQRFNDNTIDMGTGYDCFDKTAATLDPTISSVARRNRVFLKKEMEKAGFENYPKEWWHYTLKQEPFPNTFFDVEIE